jgi:hypothetical protein
MSDFINHHSNIGRMIFYLGGEKSMKFTYSLSFEIEDDSTDENTLQWRAFWIHID